MKCILSFSRIHIRIYYIVFQCRAIDYFKCLCPFIKIPTEENRKAFFFIYFASRPEWFIPYLR